MLVSLAYLAAIATANLLVVAYGPPITVPVAFVLIGFDMGCRDHLHQRWEGRQLWLRMLALIATGGAISYLLNAAAAQVAVASTVSFVRTPFELYRQLWPHIQRSGLRRCRCGFRSVLWRVR